MTFWTSKQGVPAISPQKIWSGTNESKSSPFRPMVLHRFLCLCKQSELHTRKTFFAKRGALKCHVWLLCANHFPVLQNKDRKTREYILANLLLVFAQNLERLEVHSLMREITSERASSSTGNVQCSDWHPLPSKGKESRRNLSLPWTFFPEADFSRWKAYSARVFIFFMLLIANIWARTDVQWYQTNAAGRKIPCPYQDLKALSDRDWRFPARLSEQWKRACPTWSEWRTLSLKYSCGFYPFPLWKHQSNRNQVRVASSRFADVSHLWMKWIQTSRSEFVYIGGNVLCFLLANFELLSLQNEALWQVGVWWNLSEMTTKGRQVVLFGLALTKHLLFSVRATHPHQCHLVEITAGNSMAATQRPSTWDTETRTRTLLPRPFSRRETTEPPQEVPAVDPQALATARRCQAAVVSWNAGHFLRCQRNSKCPHPRTNLWRRPLPRPSPLVQPKAVTWRRRRITTARPRRTTTRISCALSRGGCRRTNRRCWTPRGTSRNHFRRWRPLSSSPVPWRISPARRKPDLCPAPGSITPSSPRPSSHLRSPRRRPSPRCTGPTNSTEDSTLWESHHHHRTMVLNLLWSRSLPASTRLRLPHASHTLHRTTTPITPETNQTPLGCQVTMLSCQGDSNTSCNKITLVTSMLLHQLWGRGC